MKSVTTKPAIFPWVAVDELSDSVNIGEEDLHRFLSVDEESCNFDVDMTHPEMNAPEIEVFITNQQAPLTSSQGVTTRSKMTSGFVSRDDRPGRKGKKDGWRKQAAVLKAKCEVLRMEKAVSKQRWEEGYADMAEAAQMAHSLRVAVESILEPETRRGIFSEPCTPRREDRKETSCQGLDERLRRLKTSSALRSKGVDLQINLENQAEALHKRIEMLQQRTQFQNSKQSTPEESESEMQHSDHQSIDQEDTDASTYSPLSAKANDEVYRLLKQTENGCVLEEEFARQRQTKETVRDILAQINAEAEQWIHVQGVLKNVSVEMATLQQACWKWEKRALDAECLANDRQRELEEWRLKSQTAQKKIEKLAKELSQQREVNEGVKQRHALEQSRWLNIRSGHGATSNLGYTVTVQPISNSSSSDHCRCSASKDQLEESKRAAKLCNSSRQSMQGNRVVEPSGVCTVFKDAPVVPSRLQSPRRSSPREVNETAKGKPKNIVFLPTPINEVIKAPGTGPKTQRSVKERPVSVDRLSSRAPVRKASPMRSASIFTENQENLCTSVNGGSSAMKTVFGTRVQSPARRSGQSPAPGCRGPSPTRANFSVHQRGPLKDMNQVDARMPRKSDFVKKPPTDT